MGWDERKTSMLSFLLRSGLQKEGVPEAGMVLNKKDRGKEGFRSALLGKMVGYVWP